jgi:hypothetical protein
MKNIIEIKIALIIASIAILMILSSCQEANVNPWLKNNNNNINPIIDYPNNVGDTWVYAYEGGATDSSWIEYDTITIKIIKKAIIETGEEATIWISTSSRGKMSKMMLDTTAVVIRGDSVVKYEKYNGDMKFDTSYWGVKYVFPLKIGDGWNQYYFYDSLLQRIDVNYTYVQEKIQFIIPAGIFESYRIIYYNMTYGTDIYYYYEDFAPKVGKIQETYYDLFSKLYFISKLLSYKLY